MAFISHSVGERGANPAADVNIIQTALNYYTRPPMRLLPVNGVADQSLFDRIRDFQATFMNQPDGRIDPRGTSVQRLWPVRYANPTGRAIRGADAFGAGHFNAPRGGRRHDGVDYIATPNQAVAAPMSGKVVRITRPYPTGIDANVLSGLEIHASDGSSCQIWYISPNTNLVGTLVHAGDKIGTARTLQIRYPPRPTPSRNAGVMTDHVHVRIHDRNNRPVDPSTVIPRAIAIPLP
ncbi:MAG: M23 family metallopeptidase [Gammaproteobacteria bacterium]|nr:M23 family metallopeptidase [Gammaproteobacteria bacterium]